MKLLAGWVLVLMGLVIAAPVALAESRIALVIGNGAYQNAGALKNPPNDARRMTEALTRTGFTVMSYQDLDQAGMKRAVRDFAEKLEAAGQDTVGLVFYAGHGIQVGGVNYFIPIDAQIEKEGDVAIESISADDVMASLENARNRLNIIILDACRNNPVARSFRSGTRGLARLDAPVGSMVAFSTAPGQVAADGDGDNSPYTTALVAALAEPSLKIEDVFKRVRQSVYASSGGQQVPWESSSILGDFYFSGGPTAADPIPGVAVTPPADPEVPAETEKELRAFAESYLNSASEDPADQYTAYADTIDYFDKGQISKSALVADKMAYAEKFPEQSHVIDAGSIKTSAAGDGGYTITFGYSFTVENASERIEGTGETELGVRIVNGKIIIVRETGRVLQKEAAPKAADSSTTGMRIATGICSDDSTDWTKYCVDSVLDASDAGDYGPWNLFDGQADTAWVEGEKDAGAGQILTVTFASERTVTGLTITNGYNKSQRLYERNSRPKTLRLHFSGGDERDVTVADRMGAQSIAIDPPALALLVSVEILSVYPGSKYKDTAISELTFKASP
ncbi:MAG: caspase family protein [Hyphomicrobiaceae bacterium]